MKIGVLTSAYPEYEDDPHGIFVHRLMKEIKKKGHEVKVLAPFTGGKTHYIMDGVEIERFNYFYPRKWQRLCGRSGMVDNVKEGFFVKIQLFGFLFFNVIYTLLKFRDVDLVHVQWPIPNGLGALLLKKIYGIPYINTIHGEEVYLSKRFHTLPILRYLVNNSSKSITNSSGTLKICLDSNLNKEKLEVIPFGVDTDFFKPLNLDNDENIFQILSVGYLIERKGFEYLIKAMKEVLSKHENVQLKIVGSGPLENKLNNIITDLELNEKVEILKNVSDEELLKLYNLSDLFVLPSVVDSQGNTEGLGVVLLEAMACGLPVIGSDVGGIPDIIEDNKNGLLVPEKNILLISDTIILLIEDASIRKKLIRQAFKTIQKNFTWKVVAQGYIENYIKLSNP